MKKEKRINRQFWWAVLMSIIGVLLFFVSFAVPPIGYIDPTVLTAGGEILTFSGALVGIDYSYKKKELINNMNNKE